MAQFTCSKWRVIITLPRDRIQLPKLKGYHNPSTWQSWQRFSFLKAKQLKTSFLREIIAKFSFLKVTQSLLSILSFFFGRSDWILWTLFFRKFLHFSKIFLMMLLLVWKWVTKHFKVHDVFKNVYARPKKSMRSILFVKESHTQLLALRQTLWANLTFKRNAGFCS